MAGEATNAVPLKHLHTLYRLGSIGNQTDGQLLGHFVAGREGAAEDAFAELVQRHGPMVLRICHQVLGDPHEAQDAFQATFLVLVRRAGSVRNRDSVASWLYGVALRVARRARSDAARRRTHEQRRAAITAESAGGGGGPECWPELHEEIARLPERYRAPIVLCYLEGLTTEAAAQRLGCSQGTVLSRLSRARERLRGRLTRRGLTLPAGLLAAGLSPKEATAAVLAGPMARAAMQFMAGRAASAGTISAPVAALTEGVLKTMFLTRARTAGLALMIVLAIGVGTAGVIAGQATGPQDRAVNGPATAPAPNPAAGPAPRDRATQALVAARVATAREIFEQDMGRLRAPMTGSTVEAPYTWSRRWMQDQVRLGGDQAERLAALQAHLDRMKELEKLMAEYAKAKMARASDALKATYDRLEAEQFLAEAKDDRGNASFPHQSQDIP